jgi:hypothetical protein
MRLFMFLCGYSCYAVCCGIVTRFLMYLSAVSIAAPCISTVFFAIDHPSRISPNTAKQHMSFALHLHHAGACTLDNVAFLLLKLEFWFLIAPLMRRCRGPHTAV